MTSYLLWTLCFLVCLNCAYSKQCKKYECLDYKVLNKTDDYEIRQYPPNKFVRTRVKGFGFYQSSVKMFMRLLKYIKGGNEVKQKIPMTYPVLKIFRAKEGIPVEEDYAMMFNLPKRFQEKPPMPTNKEVRIRVASRGEKIIVRSFGGWALKSRIYHHQKILKEQLDKLGLKYKKSGFASATYNSPIEIFGRHNEVMYALY